MILVTLDFETYWTKPSEGYTLSRMSAAQYVMDPRFKAHGIAVKVDDRPSSWVTHTSLPALFSRLPWSKIVVMGHNMGGFDALILEWIYGVRPLAYIDTMSLARAVLGVRSDGYSLDAVSAALGMEGKQYRDAFANTQGHRDLPPEIERALIPYALNDADKCYNIYKALRAHIPKSEWAIIDWCVKCACRPMLRLNVPLLWQAHEEEVERKRNVIESIGGAAFDDMRADIAQQSKGKLDLFEAGKKILNSNDKMAAMLRPLLDEWEIEMPMKASKARNKVGELTYAFAASDEEFVSLQEHPDERIASLVEARLAVKGSIVETRTKRMAEVGEAMPNALWPVGINYSGAVATHRYSGNQVGGGNAQNLKRGSLLRDAIEAPEGMIIVAGDLSQIELRIAAFMANVTEILAMLQSGGDLYSHFAGYIYERVINKKDDPEERQVGKVGVLSLDYGAAYLAFMRMLLVQAKMHVTPEFAQRVVKIFRETYPGFQIAWGDCRKCIAAWVRGEVPPEHIRVNLPSAYSWGVGDITLPSGLKLKYYDMVQRRVFNKFTNTWEMQYIYPSSEKKKSFWLKNENGDIIDTSTKYQSLKGHTLFENLGQSGAREIMKHIQMRAARELPYMPQVLQVHDELVCLAPIYRAKEAAVGLAQIMNDEVPFWPGLPVAAEVGMHRQYGQLVKHPLKKVLEL